MGIRAESGAPFSVQTSAPLRDAAVVGMAVNFSFHNRLTLFAGYELQFWRASTFEQLQDRFPGITAGTLGGSGKRHCPVFVYSLGGALVSAFVC